MFFSGGGMPFFGGMPFGGMHGMGGDDDEDEAPRKPVDNSKFYNLLGVAKDASQGEIKKAYMMLAKKEHPDKGGDPEKFKAIAKAYEVLSDPEKRAAYDRYGEDGADNAGGGGHSPEDVFSMLFGGGARRAQTGPRKSDDTVHPLKVTLEDLYCGKKAKIAVARSIYEKSADGPIRDRSGNSYIKKTERQVLEVMVEKGMKNGQRIVFEGKGDVMPGALPGDVVLVLEEKEHDTFQRRGSDLIMKKEITLYEALAGVHMVINHLDGHKVVIKSKAGQVISPDLTREVPGEGMPIYGHTQIKGVLFIQFDVKFPTKVDLSDGMRKVLAGILPAPAPIKQEAGLPNPVELEEPDAEARRARERLAKDAYDSDEEGGGGGAGAGFGGQTVQCAQQ